ncbi:hypothetical protein Pfo_008523 [Paulownia fortunei]|nr:hypothetical protein Pfo_008523 [Paulownia fortunei]
MVLGWRRAFCTSIPKDQERDSQIIRHKSDPSPRLSSRLSGFFSDPSTPRLHSQPVSSPTLRCRTTATPQAAPTNAAVPSNKPPQSPKLQCKTRNSHRFFHRSAPSSPRSPSSFSLLKSSLRLSKQSRCGICLESVKTGQGTAIFTAECGHSFHFPCIAAHMKKQGSLTCPICNFTWKEMRLLSTDHHQKPLPHQAQKRGDALGRDSNTKNDKRCVLKVYNDDEPLSSPTSGARFNPIPESDETEEETEEFPGFFVTNNVVSADMKTRNVEVALLSEAAVVSVGKTSETYAVVLKLKAPAAPLRRAPIDLVTVLNVSRSVTADKLHLMRRVMRMVVSSLSAADRLSIVAFSTTSKRLLPLRRMTTAGRRSARRIIDAIVSLDGGASSATDSLKKAAKVIEDRREKNPAASILLFSDGHRSSPLVSSTRFSHLEIPVHSVNLTAWLNAPPDNKFARCITGLLGEVMQDLKIQLGFTSGSAPAEISAVYSYTGKPAFVGSGSSWCRVGDFHSEEERELLIELKVPSSLGGAHRLLSVRCSYKDPSTQQTIYDKERPLLIPRPRAVGSSTRDIQRLRCLFVTTRAVAESRRLAERNDVAGAHHMLASARSLVLHSGSSSGSGEEFVRGLEAELAELNWKMQDQMLPRRMNSHEREAARADEKAEPLTPTSAWRAAERLAKVAIMRKSLNRVSDLHGFENARF